MFMFHFNYFAGGGYRPPRTSPLGSLRLPRPPAQGSGGLLVPDPCPGRLPHPRTVGDMLPLAGLRIQSLRSALRGIEKKAQEKKLDDIVVIVQHNIQECAGKMGTQMGLPAEWDS